MVVYGQRCAWLLAMVMMNEFRTIKVVSQRIFQFSRKFSDFDDECCNYLTHSINLSSNPKDPGFDRPRAQCGDHDHHHLSIPTTKINRMLHVKSTLARGQK